MNNIIAYHVSSECYSTNESVKLPDESYFIHRLIKSEPHYKKFEDIVEEGRPSNAYSRFTSLFAYPDLGACKAFWDKESAYNGISAVYYKVSIVNASRVPSSLVSRISYRIAHGLPYSDIVKEFWAASSSWKCWEFMCAEFTILEIVSAPEANEVYSYTDRYQDDYNLAKRMWPNQGGEEVRTT